jgi:hypothetical protein
MSSTDSPWRKSTYSGGVSGNCVEVAATDTVLVRDTVDRDGVTLVVPARAWASFVRSL